MGSSCSCGRIDTQVKLRGYRIELGEIESQLMAMPGIESAACVLRAEPDVSGLRLSLSVNKGMPSACLI